MLEDAGATISTLPPQPNLPDLVFTANAAIIFGRRAILSNFRFGQRQQEQPINEAWFRDHGFDVEILPSDFAFEGAGDALFCGDTLYAGYRIAEEQTVRAAQALRAFAPWAVLIVLLFVAGVWIVYQPMEMRGTMGLPS